jgi:hypothetical protein
MAGKPATVRVLHRAVDSDDEGSGRNSQTASPQCTMQELKAANESLKQRLEQVGSPSAFGSFLQLPACLVMPHGHASHCHICIASFSLAPAVGQYQQ